MVNAARARARPGGRGRARDRAGARAAAAAKTIAAKLDGDQLTAELDDRQVGALSVRGDVGVGLALDRGDAARDRGRAGSAADRAADGARRSARRLEPAPRRARVRDRGRLRRRRRPSWCGSPARIAARSRSRSTAPQRVQGKLMWDIAELAGAERRRRSLLDRGQGQRHRSAARTSASRASCTCA